MAGEILIDGSQDRGAGEFLWTPRHPSPGHTARVRPKACPKPEYYFPLYDELMSSALTV